MTKAKISIVVVLSGLLILTGCAIPPRQSTVSLNGRALVKSWRCETPEERAGLDGARPNGSFATLSEKLLQCPFYRDYQIEAMQKDANTVLPYATLSEIVYKMRWGIDFQYREYEKFIQRGPKKRLFIPRTLGNMYPEFADLLQFGDIVLERPEKLGVAGPLVVRQMQIDRDLTGRVIDQRLAGFKSGKKAYPIWQAIIDLDAYFSAGTIAGGLASLQRVQSGDVKTQSGL